MGDIDTPTPDPQDQRPTPEQLAAIDRDPAAFVRAMRDTHRRVSADVFRLRGEVLSEAAGIERELDRAIGWYFDVPTDKSREFDGWLMSMMTVSQKADILRRIMRPAKKSFVARLFTRLDDSITFRNSIAHSSVGLGWEDHAHRPESQWTKNTGAEAVETDSEQLELWLAEMEELALCFAIFAMAILCEARPFDSQINWPEYFLRVCPHGIIHAPNKWLDAIGEAGDVPDEWKPKPPRPLRGRAYGSP